MSKKCECPRFKMVDGDLVCTECGEPSTSEKWRVNVHGAKAVEQSRTEDKSRRLSFNK